MMASPMTQAYGEITKHPRLIEFFGAGKIFREMVPKDITESKDITQHLPLGRLSDIQNMDGGYASNRATYTESMIQFSAWDTGFGKLDKLQDILREIMPEMGYTLTFSYTTYDPDMDLPYLILRYSYEKAV